MAKNNKEPQDRLYELGNAPIGKLLFKYSLPAVIGTVVSAIYNIIDSIVIGHAIDDPNVVSGIAVTFPVMNLVTALERGQMITMEEIGKAFTGTDRMQYLLPFEAISVLLLASIIGGVTVARKR